MAARRSRIRPADAARARERERLLAMVSDSMLDMVTEVGPDLRYRWLSPSVARVMGLDPLGEVGADATDRVHPDDLPGLLEATRAAIAARAPTLRFEYRYRHGAGHYVWSELVGRLFFDARGDFTGGVIGSRDISARRAAEEAIRDSQAQLAHAQKLESIGRLASGVAHDFNNLLTAMRGHLELMRLEPALSASARTRLGEVVQAVESGARLTGQLLAFARRQPRSPEVVELDALLRPLAPLLARLLGENVEVRLELGADADRVRVDRGELEQVVANLAVNARDAMPRGGTLTLSTRRIAAGEEPGSPAVADRGADWLALAVADTGCGIDEATRAHLFEPFFTTKPPGQGTGLGLAMVRDIATRSGGRVEVESTVGRGTTFTILLPRVADVAVTPVAPAATAAPARMQGGSEVILLVEDSPLVRDLAAELLGWLGYRVLACATGEEALEVAADPALRIDLLLTDLVLPRMNGRELAERLAARRFGLRVLYTSGYADDVLGPLGAGEQPPRFLAKPYTPQTLSAKIREALAAR